MDRKLILATSVITMFAFSLILTNITTAPPDPPIIAIDPKLSSHTPTTTFVLNVTISGVTLENTGGHGICAWEVGIEFNNNTLNGVSITEGPWLKTAGTTRKVSSKIVNSTNPGTVVVSYSLFPVKTPGALGSGTLCNITFQVMNNGRSDLHFYKTSLRAWTGSTYLVIDHSSVDGFFQFPQGDADGDGDVDSADLSDLQEAYGSTPSSSNWNTDCDFNKDSNIECLDLYILGKHYGES